MEALALPRNFVHHFRYQLKWVDPKLREKLSSKARSETNPLVGYDVVISYLYQELLPDDKWDWKRVYAARRGSIVDCYKNGTRDSDVAHFYFKVTDYFDYAGDKLGAASGFQKTVEESSGSGRLGNKYYSILGDSPNIPVAEATADESAFHAFTEALQPSHLKSPEIIQPKQYFPVFCFFRGLVSSKSVILQPKYDEVSQKSYYELDESSKYVFRFSYHFPSPFAPGPDSEMNLLGYTEYFASPQTNRTLVASPYDEESVVVVPRAVERRVWSSLDFNTRIKAPDGNKYVTLDILRSFLVVIKPRAIRTLLATIDGFGAVGLAIGTTGIAIWAITKGDALLYLSIVGFGLSAFLNLVTRVWKTYS